MGRKTKGRSWHQVALSERAKADLEQRIETDRKRRRRREGEQARKKKRKAAADARRRNR